MLRQHRWTGDQRTSRPGEIRVCVAAAIFSGFSLACTRGPIGERVDTAALVDSASQTAQSALRITPAMSRSETSSTTARHLLRADSFGTAPLTCTPTTFGPGDTLTLRMRVPHGASLTVTRSDRTVYLVVYPPLRNRARSYSLIPSEEFRGIATLRLPADVRAIPYVAGRDTILERVFSEPGKYLVQMGDNLGSDFGDEPSSCNLTFRRP